MSEHGKSGVAGAVAVVTGASSGIGYGVAAELAARGAAVGINFLSDGKTAEALAQTIRERGGRALAIQADVSIEADVVRMVQRCVSEFGRLDIMVPNAGLQKDAGIAEMSLAEWNLVISVNLTGQFLCCREAIKQFRVQEQAGRPFRSAGAIVCMSSVHDRIPWAGHVNYASSKGGIRMMVETLAQEVAHEGIRVNAIAPGAIKTDINRSAWETEAALAQLLTLIPYGRIGLPEDIARVVAWLVTDEADYVTGTTLYVDGGMTLYPEFRGHG